MASDKFNQELIADKLKFVAQAAISQSSVLSDYYLKTNLSRPFMILIEPTLRCPMGCKFCDLPSDLTFPRSVELELDQWKRILSEIRAHLPLAREIFISGGEPFLRPDLCDILEHAHQIGLGTRMITIGAFCTKQICDRLISSPMKWLKFSIHSADSSIHDELVRRPSFHKAIETIRYLRENQYPGKLGILTTVWQKNVSQLSSIVHLARDIGVDSVFFRPLFGNTKAVRHFEEPAPLHAECVINDTYALRSAIDELKQLRKEGLPIANSDQQLELIYLQGIGANNGLPNCHMMYESIYIRPNGDVEVCGHMTLGTMGNVAETTLEQVLFSRDAYLARHIVDRKCQCQGNAFVRKTLAEKLALLRQI